MVDSFPYSQHMSTLSREYTPEHSPDYGRAGLRGVVEQGVPIRQQWVPHTDGISDQILILLIVKPRLPAFGVQVSVCAEEWQEGSRLKKMKNKKHPLEHKVLECEPFLRPSW